MLRYFHSQSSYTHVCAFRPFRRARAAAVGREAFIDVKKPLYTAFEYMLGLTCQRLGSIGQTDAMVPRDGSGMLRSRAVGPSGPRIGEDGTAPLFSQCMSCCSHLDEAGEPSAGSGRPRPRPVERPDGPDGYGRLRRGPRGGEGVKH